MTCVTIVEVHLKTIKAILASLDVHKVGMWVIYAYSTLACL